MYLHAVHYEDDPEAYNALGLLYEQGIGLEIKRSRLDISKSKAGGSSEALPP